MFHPTEITRTLRSAQKLLEAGKLAASEALYTQVLKRNPTNAQALHGLGLIALHAGRADIGADLLKRASLAQPTNAEIFKHLGVACQRLGRSADAAGYLRHATMLRPDSADAHSNLGVAIKALGRLSEAIEQFERALAINPGYADAATNLCNTLCELGRFGEALTRCERAKTQAPNHAGLQNCLGVAFAQMGRMEDAIACLRRAVDLDAGFFDARMNLGNALFEATAPVEAASSFEAALRIRPASADARALLADARLHLCAWQDEPDSDETLVSGMAPLPANASPFVMLTQTSAPEIQYAQAKQWAERHLAHYVRMREGLGFDAPRERTARLRVGYLSADYRSHATSYLIAEMLELHDRDAFEVIGYSYGADDGSAMRRRIVAACDRFVDVASASHVEAARAIHADGVNILVDLKGHTRGARPQIMALRPAPVQASFLGYPGTMGTDCHDYLITDRFVTPPTSAPHFTEQFAYLPDCYQPNDRRRAIAEVAPARAELGLPERGFVFCCFNNSYKLTPELFAVWMRLLRDVPDSALWLLDAGAQVRDNLQRATVVQGIAPERLLFAPRIPSPEHLARHRRADLFLDTLPCNAHTTASDALWAGLPLLTCTGQTFCSRVAGSLLHAIGLPELVTGSLPEYESLALRLSRDPVMLAQLRERLAENRLKAPLFDSARYTRHLEAAFHMMWDRHASGARPEMLQVAERQTNM